MAKRKKGAKSRKDRPPRNSTSAQPAPPSPPEKNRRALMYGVVAAAALALIFYLAIERRGASEVVATRSAAPAGTSEGGTIPEIPDLDELDAVMAATVRDAVAGVRRATGNASAWGQLGRVYQAHDYDDLARRCYERARELAPSAGEWPYYLGFLAADRGDTKDAARYFDEVVEARPRYLPVYYRLGNVLVTEGRLDEAETAYRALIDRAPHQPWGHIGLGKVARRRQEFEAAAKHLETALGIDPDHRETIYLLAMTHNETGRGDEATVMLHDLSSKTVSPLDDPLLEIMQQQTRDGQALILAANDLLAQGEHSRAETLYRQVLAADPDSYDALLNLGVVLGLTGRNDEAEASLSKAVTIDPNRADGYTMLAIAYFQTQRPEQGIEALERALQIDPSHARALQIKATLEGTLP